MVSTTQPQSPLIHVAVDKGSFAEEGLQVQSQLHTFGKTSLQSLLNHQADIATVGASTRNNGVVARRDAGILRASGLKGKRIGYTPGTTSDFFLDSMLTSAGLTRAEVTPVALKPEEMQGAIVARTVDAVSTWNFPLAQVQHVLGSNALLIYDQEVYTETYNVATQQGFLQAQPETIKRFLRALLKAETYTARNRDEVQRLMSDATRTDMDLVREVWDVFSYHVVLDPTILLTLEDETRWAMRNKLTDQTAMPDYRKYIHTGSLRSLKPDAVKLNW
ncbi:MAG: NrtA/SsuA/CpmA family ABC transporter substrate-binding protein [Burkholderiales bacterium]|nr:NrtA/SsuA/CpmA family ABC transporter substrate-binding protein [Burkholderiales bacterium]